MGVSMAFPGPRSEPRFAFIVSLIAIATVGLEVANARRLQHYKLRDVQLNADSHGEQAESDAPVPKALPIGWPPTVPKQFTNKPTEDVAQQLFSRGRQVMK